MTESLLMQNAEENIAVLRKLGQEGVRIAVDDFGTGYSSLSYLRQLPIDTLKIDRSFVRDIETDPEDAAIIQAIVAMAHCLGLRVTAEGVETRGQLEALRGWAATSTRAICSASRCRRWRSPRASSRRTSSIFACPTLKASSLRLNRRGATRDPQRKSVPRRLSVCVNRAARIATWSASRSIAPSPLAGEGWGEGTAGAAPHEATRVTRRASALQVRCHASDSLRLSSSSAGPLRLCASAVQPDGR